MSWLALVAASVWTATPSQTPTTPLQERTLTLEAAKELGLTREDVDHYQEVMQSPKALWSDDHDPLLVLGVTATSDAERARYAALYVESERRRTAAILAFGQAVQDVWLTRYPKEPLFATKAEPVQSPLPTLIAGERLAIVVNHRDSCADCLSAIQRAVAAGKTQGGTGADVYFIDADRDAMVAYGHALGIQMDDVTQRRITFNHAAPFLAQLQLKAVAPQAFKRRGDTFSALALTP